MSLEEILANEWFDEHQSVVLSTRIRLARNLDGKPFPGWAKAPQRKEVSDLCVEAVHQLPRMRKGYVLRMGDLSDLDRAVLVERHLVSKELASGKFGAAVISRDQTVSVMINEEDHLRVQVLRPGWHLRGTWNLAEQLDDALGTGLKIAFDETLGYLTACPTNVGTGLRASAMVHLPGLFLAGHMEKVTRALSQDGLAVRGWLGEGTEAAGNIFQISNQQTLGLSEDAILQHLGGWIKNLIEQECNARRKLVLDEGPKFVDRLARSLGVLRSARLLTSAEAMNLLSHLRLACDLGCLPETYRAKVDQLMIEGQPAHVQAKAGLALDSQGRDERRATFLRASLQQFPEIGDPVQG